MKLDTQRFEVGEFHCYRLADGHNLYPLGAIFADAPGDALAGVLPPEQLAAGQLSVPYTALLVDTGAYRVLIDTGAGPFAPTTGGLVTNLRAAGIEPETVDLVVFSHAHPDHIGGTLDEAGDLAFPNARFAMLRAEFDYWREGAVQAKLVAGELYGAGPIEQLILDWFRNYLPPIESRLELLEGDAEVVPGVHVIPATGHTPGHLVVMVSSGRQQLLYVGDALLHPAQAERPEWNCVFETDRRLAVETRRQLLDRASADRCLLAATHLPAVSRVVRRGRQYALES
jgi:glyoxylase-like metal-dependent hydrolase (beta-lactamase superfamily II)